uniref:Uncharacterized protein n=1 Tax=Schistosoma mansoni TaxID=6183 RepID=A0A5K4F7Q0_SCHMA
MYAVQFSLRRCGYIVVSFTVFGTVILR